MSLWADVSYHGFYSGTLSTGAKIGVYVNTNSDATVIVIDPASQTFGSNDSLKFTSTGALTGTYSFANIAGQVAANGDLTGTVTPVGFTFTARRAPVAGATRSRAGYYQGWAFDPSNRKLAMTALVSADGQFYMRLADGSNVVDAGHGTINADGTISFTDASGRVSSGSIVTTAANLVWNGSYTKAGVGAHTFIIGRRTAANKLVNISTLGTAGGAAGDLVAGFYVDGGAKTVLIRGIGPGLTPHGVTGVVADPLLRLFDGQNLIATNDNWNATLPSTNAAEVRDLTAQAGAFALPEGSTDAVLLIRLEPGLYSARLGAAASGIGMIEVYEVQ